jgi:predicted nucleic acid-binding protein
LDTSFFIRLLSPGDALHGNAKDYFRRFLRKGTILKCSTISVAEYCVKGPYTELPLKNLQILPFNFSHALKAGKIAEVLFRQKNKLVTKDRTIIPNDSKLFAQADIETEIEAYVSSDIESKKLFETVKKEISLSFQFWDLNVPANEPFGELPIEEVD